MKSGFPIKFKVTWQIFLFKKEKEEGEGDFTSPLPLKTIDK
jgi:hypothetical protein